MACPVASSQYVTPVHDRFPAEETQGIHIEGGGVLHTANRINGIVVGIQAENMKAGKAHRRHIHTNNANFVQRGWYKVRSQEAQQNIHQEYNSSSCQAAHRRILSAGEANTGLSLQLQVQHAIQTGRHVVEGMACKRRQKHTGRQVSSMGAR
jgi:hypothetical protein